jgi:hypothetical protein
MRDPGDGNHRNGFYVSQLLHDAANQEYPLPRAWIASESAHQGSPLDNIVEVEEREKRRAEAILAMKVKIRSIVRVTRKPEIRLGD